MCEISGLVWGASQILSPSADSREGGSNDQGWIEPGKGIVAEPMMIEITNDRMHAAASVLGCFSNIIETTI
jgi:hypothetical protein